MKIADVSVDRPLAITMLILAMVIVGIYFAPKLDVDLMPDMELPVALVMTTYSGAAPAEVEKNVSEPIESVMATVSDIEELSSISQYGLSLVIVQFDWGTDMDTAINNMRDKIDLAKASLPDDADSPMLIKLDINSAPIITYSLKGADLVSLNSVADDTIVPRLERISGVASVDTRGGREREIQVHLDPAKMNAYGISVAQVIQAIGSDSVTGSAGNIERGSREISLRVMGEYANTTDVKNIQVSLSSGGSIALRELAVVEDSYKKMETYAFVNGETALSINVTKASGGNTVQVASDVREEVNALNTLLPAGVELQLITDSSEYISDSINTVVEHALLGALIATVLLFLFFRSFRSTLIIITVLPVSIITAFCLMYFSGQTINLITLSGMLLGLGSLIDFAVVSLESIFRYRENNYGMTEAAKKGTAEVATAVLASASCQIVVFVPVLFVEGLAGVLFKPMALVVIFTHLAALFTAVTLVPMMASKLLVKVENDENIMEVKSYNPLILFGKFIYKLTGVYKVGLQWSLGHRKTVIGVTVLLLVASILSLNKVGADFMPSMDQSSVSLTVELASGTKLEDTAKVVRDLEALIHREVPEMKLISSTVGSGGSSFISTTSGDAASISIELVPLAERTASTDEVVERLRKATANIIGADISISAASTGIGSSSDVEVTIRGDNMDILKQLGDSLVGLLEQVEGTREVTNSMDDAKLETRVVIDREQASRYGLTANQILNAVRATLDGQLAGKVRTEEDELNIRLFIKYDMPITMGELGNITIVSSSGAKVPLSVVARIENHDAPVSIDRSSQSREVTVSCAVSGRDTGSVNTEVRTLLNDFSLPEGYILEFGGSAQDMLESFTSLGIALLLAIVLMFMIMVALFESLSQPFVIMFCLPPTFIGAVLGLLVTGHTLSVSAFLGAIMLIGVVVNNAIVLVDYINTLRHRDGMERNEAVLRAGPVRLRPILITALSTIMVLMPMAFRGGEGSEMQQPMAVVVVFGLTVSTLVTLFLVPVVYTVIDDFTKAMARLYDRIFKGGKKPDVLLEKS